MRNPTKARAFFPTYNQRFDLSSAEKFGEVTFLVKSDIPSPFRTQELVERLETELSLLEFNPSVDYIGLTGSTIHVSLLTAAVAANHEVFNVLMFDAVEDRYVIREIDLS